MRDNLNRTATVQAVGPDELGIDGFGTGGLGTDGGATLCPVATTVGDDISLALTGRIDTVDTGLLEVEIELWKRQPPRRLARFAYPVRRGQLRRVGHVISDAVYRRIRLHYGHPDPAPGPFDSCIAVVERDEEQAASGGGILTVVDQDGANRRVIRTATPVAAVGFGASAGEVVVLSPGSRANAYVLNLVTRQTEILGRFVGMGDPPRFFHRTDDLLLAFAPREGVGAGNRDIYRQRPPWGRPARALTRLTDHPAADYSPDLSPDDGTIVFVLERSGTPHLWTKAVGGGAANPLTRGPNRYADPAWSPRGDGIAAVETGAAGRRLVLLSPGGSDPIDLAPCNAAGRPSWAPNGEMIVYINRAGQLVVIDRFGRRRDVLRTKSAPLFPAWSPPIDRVSG